MNRLVVVCGTLSLLLNACSAGPLLKVSFNDLSPSSSTEGYSQAKTIGDALSNDGIIAITNVPNFKAIRRAALLAVGECLETPSVESVGESSVTKMALPDGTERLSILTKTTRSLQSPLSGEVVSKCAEIQSATDPLRDTMSTIAKSLAGALDTVFSTKNVDEKPFFAGKTQATTGVSDGAVDQAWSSFDDLISRGDQLEHFHSYSQHSAAADSTKPKTIEYHTDAGLFILFTPALYSDDILERRGDHADFTYLDRNGEEHSIVVQSSAGPAVVTSGSSNVDVVAPDTVILMMGQGAEQFLNPVLKQGEFGNKLRAVPHALTMSAQAGAADLRRNWYGRMFLPPGEAWLADHQSTYAEVRAQLVFQAAQHRASPGSASAQAAVRDIALPAGCGLGVPSASAATASSGNSAGAGGGVGGGAAPYNTHLRSVYGSSAVGALALTELSMVGCAEGEISCWATCMPIAPYNLTCPSYEITCIDTSGNPTDPTQHIPSNQPGCVGQYVDPGGYCQGSGVNMYMEGFVSYVTGKYRTAGGSTTPQCLVLWFEDWKLDSQGKFAAACFGCLLMGILTEGFAYLRRRARDVLRAKPQLLQKLTHCALYASHLVFSYLCMLIAMTYQVELFVCVIAGLAMGHGLFNYKPVAPLQEAGGSKKNSFTDADKGYQSNVDDDVVDACCQYLSMEDDESQHGAAPAAGSVRAMVQPGGAGGGGGSSGVNNPIR